MEGPHALVLNFVAKKKTASPIPFFDFQGLSMVKFGMTFPVPY